MKCYENLSRFTEQELQELTILLQIPAIQALGKELSDSALYRCDPPVEHIHKLDPPESYDGEDNPSWTLDSLTLSESNITEAAFLGHPIHDPGCQSNQSHPGIPPCEYCAGSVVNLLDYCERLESPQELQIPRS